MASFLIDMGLEIPSLVLIGRPGVGKTTVLREFASLLSLNMSLNVAVVDKTLEIAGAGLEPHPAIGCARWMPVGHQAKQADIMREAVENQSPHVIIVDEISSESEVEAGQTIAQRGVALIATVHGDTLAELINDRERGPLMGGVQSVTLSDRAASRRTDRRKSVQKRRHIPVFQRTSAPAASYASRRSDWPHNSCGLYSSSHCKGLWKRAATRDIL
mmetsp:Transcript_25633/g.71687  ORF Transcript_25633/g.71687 Transcript_25633/m.71687 type:complete len:216 (+) Transcript_25633:596-1243(+)